LKSLSRKILVLIEQSRLQVAKIANTAMVYTYFEIGKMIVEELQLGEKRAAYGSKLLKETSIDLTKKLGRGFSETNLKQMRDFYLVYSIRQIPSDELYIIKPKLKKIANNENAQVSLKEGKIVSLNENNKKKFSLGWSHYLFLMRIKNEEERNFYEIESTENYWSLSILIRQFNTGLYERIALSKNKSKIKELSKKGHVIEKPEDILKEPLVLEFLGLEENTNYSETDLETAIINEIEKFMLEMGKGFFFGGRQVRFTFDEDHYRVDLVFYNRLLQCFVLIDLKIGKLSHQDIGQMQMYVNYYDRFVKADTENKTIGIILCKDKNKSLVEITLPENNTQIFASKYQTILPSKITLQRILDNHNQ
jgi:predicted nuclease of restriction endonuclease-like (RecB) superfamily